MREHLERMLAEKHMTRKTYEHALRDLERWEEIKRQELRHQSVEKAALEAVMEVPERFGQKSNGEDFGRKGGDDG